MKKVTMKKSEIIEEMEATYLFYLERMYFWRKAAENAEEWNVSTAQRREKAATMAASALAGILRKAGMSINEFQEIHERAKATANGEQG